MACPLEHRLSQMTLGSSMMTRSAIEDLLVAHSFNTLQFHYLITFPGSQTCRLRIVLRTTPVRAQV